MKSGLAIQRNGVASLPAHAIKRTNYTEIFHGSGKMALTPAEHGSTMTRRTSGSLCGSEVREGGRIRRRASSAEDSLHRQNQTGPEGAHFVLGEACLLEEPTCSNCEGVYVTRKLQAHACRELLSEIIVTCDLKVGIATIKVNVVN